MESEQLLLLAGNLTTNVTFAGVRGMAGGQGCSPPRSPDKGRWRCSRGGPLIHLEVSPSTRWSSTPTRSCARGQLTQSFDTDVSWRTAVGQGSGEAFSLRWAGTGVVSIQPAER